MGRRRAKPRKLNSVANKNEQMAYNVLRKLADIEIPDDFSINDPVWIYCGKENDTKSDLKIKHLLYARAALGE